MYIHLYHGRKDPNQDMDDNIHAQKNGGWGTDGGQFEITHLISTYQSHIRVFTKEYPDSIDLSFGENCLYYDGVYYGDWCISDERHEDLELKVFDENKAIRPK